MFGLGKKLRVLKEALIEHKSKDPAADGFVLTSTDRCTHIVDQLNPIERLLKAYVKELNAFKPNCQGLLNNTRGIISMHSPITGDTTPADFPSPTLPHNVGTDPLSGGDGAVLDQAVISPCERWLSEFYKVRDERMPAMEKVRLELDSRRRQELELKDNVTHLQTDVLAVSTDPAKHNKHTKKFEDAAHLLAHKQNKMFGTSKTFEDMEAANYQHLRALADDSEQIPAYLAASLQYYRDQFDRVLETFPPECRQIPSASALDSSNHDELWRHANSPNFLPPVLPAPVPAAPIGSPLPAAHYESPHHAQAAAVPIVAPLPTEIPFEPAHSPALPAAATADFASENHGALRDVTQDQPFVREVAGEQYDGSVPQYNEAARDGPLALAKQYLSTNATASPTSQYNEGFDGASSQQYESGKHEVQFQHAPAPLTDSYSVQDTMVTPSLTQYQQQYQHAPAPSVEQYDSPSHIVPSVSQYESEDLPVPLVSGYDSQLAGGVPPVSQYERHAAGTAPANPRNPYLQQFNATLASDEQVQAHEQAVPPQHSEGYSAAVPPAQQYGSGRQYSDVQQQQQYEQPELQQGVRNQYVGANEFGGGNEGLVKPSWGSGEGRAPVMGAGHQLEVGSQLERGEQYVDAGQYGANPGSQNEATAVATPAGMMPAAHL